MDRRDFVKAFPAFGLACVYSRCQARSSCIKVPDASAAVRCTVGLESQVMNVMAKEQHQTQWCWAACIQMIMTYYSHPVTQERIVLETWGNIANMPAAEEQILEALNREWVDEHGQEFYTTASAYATDVATAVQQLQLDRPLIIGTNHHAMLLTALSFTRDDLQSRFIVHDARVRDPWPGRGLRSLTQAEWEGIRFAATVGVYD